MKEGKSASGRTGRPLSFDRDEALRQAMLTFWQYGYETTSITDLTSAMGISTPSLYGSFKDKKRLFLKVVELYAGNRDVIAREIAEAPSSLKAARAMLEGAVVTFTGETTPSGCLLASATASGSAASIDVREAVAEVRAFIGSHLQKRIKRDVADGVLPPNTNAAALAGLVLAVTQGLSVLARDGSGRAALQEVAAKALDAWPQP